MGSAIRHSYAYGYDTAGRLGSVWHQPTLDPATKAPQGVADFSYGYEPGSDGLIKTVTGPAHHLTNTWEASRNVLDKKENKSGATNFSS